MEASLEHTRPPLVLLVDDQLPVRQALQALLEEFGFRVRAAASGAEAIELHQLEPVDALVTDIRLPRMSGFELVDRLLSRQPSLPVIFMSGYSDRVPELGPTRRLLAKPFQLDDLVDALNEMLAVPRPP